MLTGGGQLLLGLEERDRAPYITLLGLDYMSRRFKGALGWMVKRQAARCGLARKKSLPLGYPRRMCLMGAVR